jgi:uncharacterized protein (DUF697 family)
MTTDQRDRCSVVIHAASGLAGVVGGVSPLPGSDSVLIMPIQVGMVIQLGRIFEVEVSESAAKSVVYATLAQILGKGSAKVLTFFMPGIGNLVRAGVAVAATEALGWAIADNLASGAF